MNIFHFSANTRKRSKNSQFDKLGDNEEWVDFGSCSTIKWILLARSSILLLGYTYIIYIFFSQIIFEVKVNVNFIFIFILIIKPFWSTTTKCENEKLCCYCFVNTRRTGIGLLTGLFLVLQFLCAVPAHNTLSEKLNTSYFTKTTWRLKIVGKIHNCALKLDSLTFLWA